MHCLAFNFPFLFPVSVQGTSAPIAIPNMMNRWRSDSKSGAGQQEAASTFIPPHQLSKQDDFMFRCASCWQFSLQSCNVAMWHKRGGGVARMPSSPRKMACTVAM
jgi:hypothetical protein